MSSQVRSNLQRLVLQTYADFLRASRNLDPSIRENIRREFRAAATDIKPNELLRIEYYLRRANRQLSELKKGDITSISSITVSQKQ